MQHDIQKYETDYTAIFAPQQFNGSVECRTAYVGEGREKRRRCDAKRLYGLFKKEEAEYACGEGV